MIDNEALQNDYNEFSKQLESHPLAMSVVGETFKAATLPEWPSQFYSARDEIWPIIFGVGGAKFLLKVLYEGINDLVDIVEMKESDVTVLRLWHLLYCGITQRAENCAINPAGWREANFVFNRAGAYMVRFIRNDGEALGMTLDGNNMAQMIQVIYENMKLWEDITKKNVDPVLWKSVLKKINTSESI